MKHPAESPYHEPSHPPADQRGCWKIGDSVSGISCFGIAEDNPRTFDDLDKCVSTMSGHMSVSFPGTDGCQQCLKKSGGEVYYTVEGTGRFSPGVTPDCTWHKESSTPG